MRANKHQLDSCARVFFLSMLERAIQKVWGIEDTLFLEKKIENVRANQFYKSICLDIF